MNSPSMLTQLPDPPSSPRRPPLLERIRSNPRNAVISLAVCLGLQMTSYVMILPLFARRFPQLGAGVQDLSTSAMAYALAATIAAPFMGGLSDRFGRRPLVLSSLAVYVLAFTGYLFASSGTAFIILRGAAGALTAGLIPAATAIVADLAPNDRRGQWIGIMNGGASIGWIVGPVLGGLLYDRWGYSVAIIVAILMAVVTLVVALLALPESRTRPVKASQQAAALLRPRQPVAGRFSLASFRSTLPASLPAFGGLLLIFFGVMFAWAFIEPRFMFYAYDDLRWDSSMLGMVMSTYGVAMMLGEFGLSRLSDRVGRKPVILVGLIFFSAQFIGLAFSLNYLWIVLAFIIAGLGNALFDPALSASILDIAPAQHQARILGIKSTLGSLGNILGPALLVLVTASVSARHIFIISAGIVALTVLAGSLLRLAPTVREAAFVQAPVPGK